MSGRRGNIERFNEVIPWYLAGGILPTNVLGAWQPKGAASYVASKISLVNPSASNLLVDGAAFPTWAAATGWTFSAASSQYLIINSAIASAPPLSMVCLFNVANVDNEQALLGIGKSAVETNRIYLSMAGSVAGDFVRFAAQKDVAYATAITTLGVTALIWYTAAGVTSATNSRVAYLNGGSKHTSVTDVAPSNMDKTAIGTTHAVLPGSYLSGSIAACAFYNVALTDAQVLAIHTAMAAL
jgi:hypothetical protein